MKEIQMTDEMLYRYMPVVDAAIMKNLEDRVDHDHGFSKKFERKMKRLMREEAHPWVKVLSGVSKKAAMVIGALAGVSLILTMSVEAYRIKFFGAMKTFLGDSYLYSYFRSTTGEEFRCGIPTYIPEGYVGEELENDGVHYYTVIYTNEDGNEIIWEQTLIEDGEKIVFDSEYDAEETREIGGRTAVFHLYEDGYIWVYYEVDNYVFFVDSDALDVDEMVKILASIKFEK